MLQIQDTLVSLDLAERFFCCDLDACRGECCIEGDAGAPITREEFDRLKELVSEVKDDLLPLAREEIEHRGVGYIDEEGDLVTSIIDGRNCVFTCYAPGGKCICALEKAFREGRTDFRKPISCYLYPLRITEYPTFTAVNYHRWKICRPAEKLGRKLGLRLYQFLKEPLTERFGQEWYDELCLACEAYLAEYGR
ncbi:MAG: DUF3109 family protein [Candidatus Amulumruptor caecigallinarius]|nr:DUF3109 family protein [Candidatus Amulumruptor caecigallinarius]MCM1395897.1 DUF3109 family protein [Candidatus Amulumruptor caecigallinarius]MCM1452932.1 DUF3109 family protein [bacterium]